MIGRSLGRYRILEEIGSGGMGVVYRARDERLERDVALKVLPKDRLGDDAARKRFHKEAKSLSKLNHPNIATLYDFDTEEGVDYLVMEYIAGVTLEDTLDHGALDEKEAVRLGMQLAEGLAAAHQQGVVHRDLKPGNLRVTPEGRLKILDLGLALLLHAPSDTATTDSRITDAGAAVGTLPYMAPEQLRGEAADERTDIYAAGAVLYEMATGRRPFPEKTGSLLLSAILTQWPKTPREVNPDVSMALEKVILKALDKLRDHRYPSAKELLEELQRIGSGQVLVAPSPPFLEREGELGRAERPVFVAREEELVKLEGFLDQALAGQGRVVFVTGEAGSGKSALVNELVRRSQEDHRDLIVANGNCNAHTGVGNPYLPFREVLALITGEVESKYRAGAISSDHATRLWHCLPVSVQSIVESGRDLIDTFIAGRALADRAESYAVDDSKWLSGLQEIVERKASLPADPTLQQSVLFKQFASVMDALAGWKPMLLVLDDLQWADGGSIGLLMYLVERIRGIRVLIIGAYRPEEVALGRRGEPHPLKEVIGECGAKFGDVEVAVGRSGSREFVDAYLDSEPNRFSDSFREAFHRHTDGHSLFTVEVLRGMKEQGSLVRDEEGRWIESEVDWGELPGRVEATIGQRIDRLPENLREVLTVASIEGEYFTSEVLAGVQEADEREMVRLLSGELDKLHQLVSAQGIRRIGSRRQFQYRFRHILFQKYLYTQLDAVECALLHERVGEALEELYGEQAGDIAVHLAHHFQTAGITEKAIQYFGKAGEKASQMSANEEAAAHFKQALELVATVPETPERDQLELRLLSGLAAVLQGSKGYGSPELFGVCDRMRELCKRVSDATLRFHALTALAIFYALRGEYTDSLGLCRDLEQLAVESGDPQQIAVSHWQYAYASLLTGEFSEALKHFEEVIAYYHRYRPRTLAYQYGLDPGVASTTWSAYALWWLGYPEKSLRRAQDAYSLAKDLGQAHSLAFALFCSKVFLLTIRRELDAIEEPIEELIELTTRESLAFYWALAVCYRGYTLTLAGQFEEGLAQMQRGMDTCRAIGTVGGITLTSMHFAEAYARANENEKALEVTGQALDIVEKNGERWAKSGLHRLKGELLLASGESEVEAEGCFQRAIDVARHQRAKIYELQAVTSLARLWQSQGKKEEARQRLAEIYNWFTEGFDTPDLKDAKALLEELSYV